MSDIAAPEEYRPEWRTAYRQEQKRLKKTLGRLLKDVQHVGGTSVPQLCACPVLDVLVTVRNGDREAALSCLREKLGYADSEASGFSLFREGDLPVSLCLLEQREEEESRRILAVRDYLTAHPEVRRVYSDLKRDLAARYTGDPESYAAGKSGFLHSIEQDALEWEGETSGLPRKMTLGMLLGGVLGAVLGQLAGAVNPSVSTVAGILLGVLLGASAGMKKDGPDR